MNADKLVGRICEAMSKRGLDFNWYPGCAEPGYDDVPVVAANWNPPNMRKWGDLIERVEREHGNVQLQWSDEWIECSECGKAIRTSPDSYSWQSSCLWTSDCTIACRECWKDTYLDIIHEYKSDYHSGFCGKALPHAILHLEAFTQEWVCWSDRSGQCQTYENGLHHGQNDNPKDVFAHIMEVDRTLDVVFVVTSTSQFDITGCAYVRETGDND